MVHIEDEDSMKELPYGEWRNQFRSQARREATPAFRTLADPRQSFPDFHPGDGELGYGTPARTTSTPSSAVDVALHRAGLVFVRQEYYGAARFPVLVANEKMSLHENQLREWGAELVRAVGNRACEVVVSNAQRYQFDRFTAGEGRGGVYVFIEDGFHPWIAGRE